MALLAEASREQIEQLRARFGRPRPLTVEEQADRFCALFAETFPSIVLVRMFLIVPFACLPEDDRAFASRLAEHREGSARRMGPKTPVLSLFASRGVEAHWNDRRASREHRAIPLLGVECVSRAPMFARLLGGFPEERVSAVRVGGVITQSLAGGCNGLFYVEDARTATDEHGQCVIRNREFVSTYGIRSVFGMGGTYADGTVASAIVFTKESVAMAAVDRLGAFICNFKIATVRAVLNQDFYRPHV